MGISFRFRIQSILLSVLFILALSLETASSEYTGSSEDLRLIALIKNTSNIYVSDRSVLWVEKDYLPDKETISLQQKIDTSIEDIERYIGIDFDKNAYRQEKIEYFIHRAINISHADQSKKYDKFWITRSRGVKPTYSRPQCKSGEILP